jgi:hypothetical protein
MKKRIVKINDLGKRSAINFYNKLCRAQIRNINKKNETKTNMGGRKAEVTTPPFARRALIITWS